MAPLEALGNAINRRSSYYCYNYYGRETCGYYSNWDLWGRWVVVAAVLIFVVILFIVLGRMDARRRRNRGVQPMYGTGWMAPPPKYPGGPAPQQGGYQPPAPPYSPPPPNAQQSQYAYGGGYQMQPQPPQQSYQPVYRGGAEMYTPPAGPPPGK